MSQAADSGDTTVDADFERFQRQREEQQQRERMQQEQERERAAREEARRLEEQQRVEEQQRYQNLGLSSHHCSEQAAALAALQAERDRQRELERASRQNVSRVLLLDRLTASTDGGGH